MTSQLISEKNTCVLVPVFNEAPVIGQVITSIRNAGFSHIIVVDDGSTDQTSVASKGTDAITLRHAINRGKGAAVRTGIEGAKILGAAAVVTVDGDGQHDPADITKMITMLNKGFDVVLGSRLRIKQKMPLLRIVANYLGNAATWVLFGLWVSDSQSGFRAYSRKAMDAIQTRTDRYAYDSEVIREIKRNNLKFVEVPVHVAYTQYSMTKKNRQNFVNGIKTLVRMLLSD